jgi:hypothetical protein
LPTIIDSLIVTLGIDVTQFKRGQKQASEDLKRTEEDSNRYAKEIEAAGKTAANFFSRLRNEALLLFGAFTGANSVKQFIENITNSDAGMARLAKQLNMSTEDLTAWTSAIERTGGSASAAAGTFQHLEDDIQNFRATGQSQLLPYLKSMGIAMLDAHGNARPLQDILLDIAKWAEGRDPAMVSQRLRAMGFDQGTINMLMKGRDAVAGLIQQSKELGVTSDADGQRAQALQERWRALEQAATSLGRTILNDLSPMVIDILGKMVQWAQANREWIDTKISDAIQVVIQKATDLYQYLSTVDWTSVWKTLIEWITQVQLQFGAFFDFLQKHWPEIKEFAVDFAANIERIASIIDKIVQATVGWTKVADALLIAWGIGRLATIIGGLTAILRLLGAITVAATGLSTKGAAGMFGGVLGKAALAAVIADMGLTAVDPNDQIGTWIDKNIPGAGYLDDLSARYLGVGRTYDQQDQAAKAAGYDGTPRGIRNNNPLNLEYRPGQGATSNDGRFGIYSNMEGGVAAASRQLLLYQDRDHLNTIKSIINKWAPPSDNNDTSGYVKQVAGMLNVDPEKQIDLHDQNMMAALVMAMAKRESGAKLSPDVVLRGVGQAMPPAGPRITTPAPLPPRNPVADLSMGAASAPGVQNSTTSTTNTNTSEINVNGPITVNTQATDAKGVAAGLLGGLKSSLTVQQANAGLN